MTAAGQDTTEHPRHPIFARFLDRLTPVTERELGAQRDRMLAGLSGRVLEIGAGNGVSFVHYPPEVEEVVALEPEPYLRAKARQVAARAPVAVRVIDGVASRLPFESDTFDAAVTALVLCTVPEPEVALAEIRRVLKEHGELRFLEHVRAENAAKARAQGVLDRTRIWPFLGGGCHCSRPTPATIAAAGFQVLELATIDFGPSWWITNPHVRGLARATSGPA
jgi:ubiquinone/menaquinone biosynthesis C-methylase UbiE